MDKEINGASATALPHPAAREPRLDILEVVRGLAALAVLLCHTDICLHFAGGGADPYRFARGLFYPGSMGVDCFFCLSGFIITWIHARDIGEPSRARHFLIRRFIRIYPPYIALVAFKFAYYFLRGSSGQTTLPMGSRILNALFLLPVDFSQPDEMQGMITVSWSLNYEVYFYLLFCGAIILGSRFARVGVAVWIVAIVAYHWTTGHPAVWRLGDMVFSPYNFEFLGGVLAARLARKEFPVSFAYAMGAAALAGLALGIGTRTFVLGPIFWSKVGLGLCFSTLLLALVRIERFRPIRVPKLFLILGAASYSIYLVHVEVFSLLSPKLTKILATEHQTLIQASYVGAILLAVIGGLIYHYRIEKPLIGRFRKWLEPRGPALVAERA